MSDCDYKVLWVPMGSTMIESFEPIFDEEDDGFTSMYHFDENFHQVTFFTDSALADDIFFYPHINDVLQDQKQPCAFEVVQMSGEQVLDYLCDDPS